MSTFRSCLLLVVVASLAAGTAGPALACTRAACRTMEFENTYTRLLGGEGTVTLSGDSLLLSSSRGVLRFAR